MSDNERLKTDFSKALGFAFDSTLGNNLSILRHATINQDFDCVGVIDGNEGGGKSLFAQQIGRFLDVDHEITADQIVFNAKQFKESINKLKKFKVIIWDEAIMGLYNRRSMSDDNIGIIEILAQCRQRNLFLLLILPSYYSLDRYAAVHRSRFLIHVKYFFKPDPEDTHPLVRGFFRFYNEEGKKRLYTNEYLRKTMSYPGLSGCYFDGRFSNTGYLVDREAYLAKKNEAMTNEARVGGVKLAEKDDGTIDLSRVLTARAAQETDVMEGGF